MKITRGPITLLIRGIQTIILAAFVVGWVFYNFQPDEKHFYQGSLLKRNLLRSIEGPRIILVGGSNLAFGIDSEMIEKSVGMPVINDGMHVGLGVAPLEELKAYIHPGDVIIVSLEYYNFIDRISFFGNPQFLADWIEVAPERINYIEDLPFEAPIIYTLMFQHKINRPLNYLLYGGTLDPIRNGYTGDKFNSYGDFIGHLDPDAPTFNVASYPYPINQFQEGMDYLRKFKEYAESKGAIVLFEAQASRKTNCDLTGSRPLQKFYTNLREATGIFILTQNEDLCLADEFFYDTPNHLNAAGRTIKTQKLIENLREYLGLN